MTGIGTIRGVVCMIIANDATTKGGSFFKETIRKHVRAQDIAFENRLPVVYLVDCGGANLAQGDEVFPDQDHFGGAFFRQCRMSAPGIPQISAVFGECTAGGAYIPALSDEVVMTAGNSSVHLGGPQIVKAAIKEIVDSETLGGAEMHSTVSGVSDHFARDETEAIAKTRDIVGALNRVQTRPWRHPSRAAAAVRRDRNSRHCRRRPDAAVRPARDHRAPGRRQRIPRIQAALRLDAGLRLRAYPRAAGRHPREQRRAVLESSLKGAHFIELCDQRNVPILFLQNITGFMVGSEAERDGIAKNSAKLVYAVANARVPRYTVVTGGSYGAGNYGMSGRGFRPRFMFMWPNARFGTMSPDVGSSVLMDLRRSSIRGIRRPKPILPSMN